jgi:flavorubredoxin
MNVIILYYSKSGHTLEAANATAAGIRSVGSEVNIVSINDFQVSMLADYDGVIVGSPCWAGKITRSGVPKPLMKVLNMIPAGCLENKRCGGISVHSAMGGDVTVKTLGKILSQKGCEDCRLGPVAKAGSSLSLWKGPSVSPQDEELFKAFGAAFVGSASLSDDF